MVIPSEPHEYARYLSEMWTCAKAGVNTGVMATLRDELETLRLNTYSKMRTMSSGTFGWSVNAITWACVAALDVASGSNSDDARATSFESVVEYRLAVKSGRICDYTRSEVVHAMRVVAHRWLFCRPTESMMSYVRALELAAGRHLKRAHNDSGEWISYCAAWTADIKRQYSAYVNMSTVEPMVPCVAWTSFCKSLVTRIASDAQRMTVYKLACTSRMQPGMLDMYLRSARTVSIPSAPTLCMHGMATAVHTKMRSRILYEPLTSFYTPRDDGVLLSLILFSAFDVWTKHSIRLHWIERFVLMLADWEQAQYVLNYRSKEPVVIQRLSGFDVWYKGECVDCGGDGSTALYNWYRIIETDFNSLVLGTYRLPLMSEVAVK